MKKIGQIRVQIQAEQQNAILLAQAYAELAAKGEGGPETVAQGAAFVTETANLEAADAKKALDEKLIANQEIINTIKAQGTDAAATTAEVTALQADSTQAIADYSAKVTEANTSAQTQVQQMINAYAEQYPEAKAEIDRWVILWDTIAGINALEEKVFAGRRNHRRGLQGNIDARGHRQVFRTRLRCGENGRRKDV